MKNLPQIIHRHTSISLVLRILIGLVIGAVLVMSYIAKANEGQGSLLLVPMAASFFGIGDDAAMSSSPL